LDENQRYPKDSIGEPIGDTAEVKRLYDAVAATSWPYFLVKPFAEDVAVWGCQSQSVNLREFAHVEWTRRRETLKQFETEEDYYLNLVYHHFGLKNEEDSLDEEGDDDGIIERNALLQGLMNGTEIPELPVHWVR
jgi:hypothetical protein